MPRAGLDTEAVVEAAARLADAAGLEALSLSALADRLDVRAPSLYAHVDGLPDLRRRLGARGARELSGAVRSAVAGRARLDALRALAHTYRAYAREHPGTYAAMQRPPDEHAGEDALAARELVGVVVAALSGYGLTGDATIHAVRVVRAGLHGFVSLERLGGFQIALSLDETFDHLVEMLHLGLSGRGTAGPPPSPRD
jgi:AcrR family transcriptional regulator